jgi:hypothetical protein
MSLEEARHLVGCAQGGGGGYPEPTFRQPWADALLVARQFEPWKGISADRGGACSAETLSAPCNHLEHVLLPGEDNIDSALDAGGHKPRFEARIPRIGRQLRGVSEV